MSSYIVIICGLVLFFFSGQEVPKKKQKLIGNDHSHKVIQKKQDHPLWELHSEKLFSAKRKTNEFLLQRQKQQKKNTKKKIEEQKEKKEKEKKKKKTKFPRRSMFRFRKKTMEYQLRVGESSFK